MNEEELEQIGEEYKKYREEISTRDNIPTEKTLNGYWSDINTILKKFSTTIEEMYKDENSLNEYISKIKTAYTNGGTLKNYISNCENFYDFWQKYNKNPNNRGMQMLDENLKNAIIEKYNEAKENEELFSQKRKTFNYKKSNTPKLEVFQQKFNIEELNNAENLVEFLFKIATNEQSVGHYLEHVLKEQETNYTYWGTFNNLHFIMKKENGIWFTNRNKDYQIEEKLVKEIADYIKSIMNKVKDIITNSDFNYTNIKSVFNSIKKFTFTANNNKTYTINPYEYIRKYCFCLFPNMFTSFIKPDDERTTGVKNLLNIQEDDQKIPLVMEEIIYNNFHDKIEDFSVDDIYHVIENNWDYLNGIKKKSGETTMPKNIPLNQILYGPPGTGKTYNTVVKAMEIIGLPEQKPDYITVNENDEYKYADLVSKINKAQECEQQEYSDTEYKVLKQAFDEAKNNHQIEFITFHQSYSYEEFVEGIKPYIPKDNCEQDKTQKDNENTEKETNTSNDIQYEIKKGVFRQIVENANKEISFDKLWKMFQDKHPVNSELKTIDDTSFHIKEYLEDGLNIDKNEDNNPKLTIKTIKELYTKHKQKIFKKPTDINKYHQDKPSYYFSIIKELENIEKKPYVLIIDEINRGNISKIFGELITLIEEDKRTGEDNAITVTLPYSQEPFSVPNNLYIIGTMNTADRSIALLDTALRRRFDFVKMPARPDLLKDKGEDGNGNVAGIYLFDLLTNLNNNITDSKIGMLDHDHEIGHAFLINVKNKDDLRRAFLNKIYPLLEEYFYNDEKTIKKVLGKDNNYDLSDIDKKDKWLTILQELAPANTETVNEEG